MRLLIFTMALFCVFGSDLKSQCFTIENRLGCQLNGTLDIYTFVNPPNGPCNSTACASNVAWSAAANGGTYPANCGQCAPACNVVVTIDLVNGITPIGPFNYDFSTTSPATFAVPITCIGGGSATIVYDPVTMTFTIY